MKQKAIICDLDGTLFDISHRLHFLKPVVGTNRDFPVETTPKKPKKDWKNFNANIPGDTINEWCRELIFAMFFRNYHIIFSSGREDIYKDVTMEGLIEGIGLENMQMIRPSLFMRKAGDHRQDNIVKTEIYKIYIEPKYDVLFCIDDRQQVVDAWRALGLTCLQCAKGDF
jgi:hypothetical protein